MTAESKDMVRQWTDEIYTHKRFERIRYLAHAEYIRHEGTGTWTAPIAEHLERIKALYQPGGGKPRLRFAYYLLAEGDKVVGFGTMRGYRGGASKEDEVYSFVQMFRLAHGKIVETWFPPFVVGVDWRNDPPLRTGPR